MHLKPKEDVQCKIARKITKKGRAKQERDCTGLNTAELIKRDGVLRKVLDWRPRSRRLGTHWKSDR